MAGDFPDIPFAQAAGDGGLRAQTQMVVIHATDNTASDEDEASYATHRPDQVSAHFYSDEDSVNQGVLLSHVAYGCYPTGNSRSIQFELCGISGKLTDATLRRIAPIVRRVCDKYGIPVKKLSPAELRAGARGICGHGDVTLAWGEGSHTDPGVDFPWPTFLDYIGGSMALKEADVNEAAAIVIWNLKPWVAETVQTVRRIEQKQGTPAAINVDASAVVDKLLTDPRFLPALAKAVNDDHARRMGS